MLLIIGIVALSFLALGVRNSLHAGEGMEADASSLIGKPAPEINDGNWINSGPLKIADLRGKVVLLEFWTFGCYNCKNTIPYIKAWNEKFHSDDFVIVGVHTPEFDQEKSVQQVRHATETLGITYPVVTDNDYKTWDAYHQEYWPALYLIDKSGIVRYMHIGEGNYSQTEKQIISLLGKSL
ncbi:MAG TPA: redoxin domain-containing protein [Bacteroidota bacterium]|nr:redoxin domain-containing protein [Bacteroidota bacterium]